MITPLYKLNAGSVIELTKEQLLESVEMTTEVEESLEDESYMFMYMGKRQSPLDDCEYLIAPYSPEIFGEKILYSYPIDDANDTTNIDIPFFRKMSQIRLLDALSTFMEEPGFDHDKYLEYEMNVAKMSLSAIKIVEELNEY